MPYITKKEKDELASQFPENPGQLNYWIMMTIQQYLITNGETYQTYNDIIGALECAKQELYRRKISKYEDKKCKENGDVF